VSFVGTRHAPEVRSRTIVASTSEAFHGATINARSGPDSHETGTLETKNDRSETMRKYLIIAAISALLVVSFASFGAAQYYGNYYYYPPYYPASPPPSYYNPYVSPVPVGRQNPYKYRLAPSPQTYWRWNQQNRLSDQEQILRSPLNPESDLGYLLRTF
jgi:hypothetical protein